MPARKYQYEREYQERIEEQAPLYQEYTPESMSTNLKEILFFLNIAFFCVSLVIFSFLFLSLKVNTTLAILLAMGASFLSLRLQRHLFKKKLKNKYYLSNK